METVRAVYVRLQKDMSIKTIIGFGIASKLGKNPLLYLIHQIRIITLKTSPSTKMALFPFVKFDLQP